MIKVMFHGIGNDTCDMSGPKWQHSITSLFHTLVWLKLNVEITLFQGHRGNGLATYVTSNLYANVFFITA